MSRFRPAVAAVAALAALALAALAPGAQAADPLAKEVFGAIAVPSPDAPRAIGSYSRGCLAGAVTLPADGDTFQAMRLSRNRRYGHPVLVGFVTELAAEAPSLGLQGLLVGDLSQPRGGPMPYGHTSHQVGLDADIWFTEMPRPPLSPEERETLPFTSMLTADGDAVEPARFTAPFKRLLQLAAEDPRVARIFVHPLLKRDLCRWGAAGETPERRSWLRKIRPWYGHHAHFHVRLNCPRTAGACRGQAPPPAGDGCGEALAYWFTPAPYTPDPDARPKPPLTLAGMPAPCRRLAATAPPLPRRHPRVLAVSAPPLASCSPAEPC